MRVHASVIREVDAINRAIFGFSLYRGTGPIDGAPSLVEFVNIR
jgi:hypothetical protein